MKIKRLKYAKTAKMGKLKYTQAGFRRKELEDLFGETVEIESIGNLEINNNVKIKFKDKEYWVSYKDLIDSESGIFHNNFEELLISSGELTEKIYKKNLSPDSLLNQLQWEIENSKDSRKEFFSKLETFNRAKMATQKEIPLKIIIDLFYFFHKK